MADAGAFETGAVVVLVIPRPDAVVPDVVVPDAVVPDELATGGRELGGLPSPKDQPSTLPGGGLNEPAPVLP